MNIFVKIFRKKIIIHILLMIISFFVFAYLVLLWLDFYTDRKETFLVGDYTGLTMEEILNNPENNKFEFIVIDSVYDNSLKKGSVVLQSPSKNTVVKRGRKIYLTIVAKQPEMVPCPNLEDLTVRQASAILETYGLKIGKIEYVESLGNTVIRWKNKGKILKPNEKVIKGSSIDLVVGNDNGRLKVLIPDLVGKTKKEAHEIISSLGLNIGSEVNCPPNKKNCIVSRQEPEPSEGGYPLGTTINLWYE